VTETPSDISSLPPTAATPTFNIVSGTEKSCSESDRDAPEHEVNPNFFPYDGEANPLCGGDFAFTVVAATSNEPEPLTRIIKAHQSFFLDVTVSVDDDNWSIRQTSPQQRASRLVPQIDASFLAKHTPTIKEKPGVLKLAQIPRYAPDHDRQGQREEEA